MLCSFQERIELEDSYLQTPQIGGAEFLNQRHMLFTNGASSSRQKRRREAFTDTNIASSVNNPFPFQQKPQLIDLTEHRNQQVVSPGLRLSFADQQQQKSLFLSSLLSSDEFAAQIKQQREQIDQLVHTQREQLSDKLSELRRKHYQAVIGEAEAAVVRRLEEKEAEAEKAARTNVELQARDAHLNVEVQVWQAKARADESTLLSLQSQLQQAIISHGGKEVILAEDAHSAYIDPDPAMQAGPSCKACCRRMATMVLLPCRHLSVCTECDGAIPACPVCFCSRGASVEVYL